MTGAGVTERPRRSDPTRDAILVAAREQFADLGFDRTTIRSVAARANTDPSLVMRYYGNKDGLFAAAADFDLRLPDLRDVPRAEVGDQLIGHFVDVWDLEASFRLLLRTAATHQVAAMRMRAIFTEQLLPAIARLQPADASEDRSAGRAAAVASQTLGLGLCRYVLELEPVATMSREDLVATFGPTLTRYLTD